MQQNITIIDGPAFIEAMEDMLCGKLAVAQISSKIFKKEQSVTYPLKGYEPTPGYPLCCDTHKNRLKIGVDTLEKFPNCCEQHKKLLTADWFNKSEYSYLPMKFVDTIDYTFHCIFEWLKKPNWFKEITDYIKYTVDSYGQFPEGYGSPLGLSLYLHNVEQNIESSENIKEPNKKQLLTFVRSFYQSQSEVGQTDLNLLINTYRTWLKIFPFELSFFAHLKAHFEKTIPILTGKGDTNRYTGLTGFKITTHKELIGVLVSTTLTIIKEINTRYLFQNDLLKDLDSIKMEIITSKRKVELEELDKADWTNREEYIKLLKKWFKGEKQFLNEITPFIRESNLNFITDLTDGIKALQKNDINETCILNVRNDSGEKETAFRYWFKNFFTARYPQAVITAEEEKGKGRIDLKISHKNFGEKLIEFKGWWNREDRNTAAQICSYLTDFEKDGYIFMINNLKRKDITQDYKQFITEENDHSIPDTWKSHQVAGSDMYYYESRHQCLGKEKIIYHFIFNVYF